MDRDDALNYRVLYTKAVAEIERVRAEVKKLTRLLDDQLGTPCEQIRHEQEIERLRARAAEVVAAWQREDDSVGEAIEVLGRALQPKEGE